ncbi:hypothetical protein GCM10020331_033030 [Ectobacillus funiculus]
MTFFTVGSIVCAIAVNFPIMMAGRVIQAVGAGIFNASWDEYLHDTLSASKARGGDGLAWCCDDF